jgi:hypothetical protein
MLLRGPCMAHRRMYVCMYTYVCIPMYVCMYVNCAYVCMSACMYMAWCMSVYVCIPGLDGCICVFTTVHALYGFCVILRRWWRTCIRVYASFEGICHLLCASSWYMYNPCDFKYHVCDFVLDQARPYDLYEQSAWRAHVVLFVWVCRHKWYV